MGNSMFDCQLEKRPEEPEMIIPPKEESKCIEDIDSLEKLKFLGISQKGLRIRNPTKWDNNPQQIHKTFD